MAEYTPTVEEVRDEWATALRGERNARCAEFDRMIAAVERAAAVKALREAADAIYHGQHAESVRQMLGRRADRIESGEQA